MLSQLIIGEQSHCHCACAHARVHVLGGIVVQSNPGEEKCLLQTYEINYS